MIPCRVIRYLWMRPHSPHAWCDTTQLPRLCRCPETRWVELRRSGGVLLGRGEEPYRPLRATAPARITAVGQLARAPLPTFACGDVPLSAVTRCSVTGLFLAPSLSGGSSSFSPHSMKP